MKVLLRVALFLLLTMLLASCLNRSKTTKSCFPATTVYITENTSSFVLIEAKSDTVQLPSFAKKTDFYACDFCGEDGALSTGTELTFDGTIVHNVKTLVGTALFFRANIEGQTVWFGHRQIYELSSDSVNQKALADMGFTENNGTISGLQNPWSCPKG